MAKKMQSPRRGNHKCLDCPRDSATEAICSLTALFTMAKQGNTFLVLTGIVRMKANYCARECNSFSVLSMTAEINSNSTTSVCHENAKTMHPSTPVITETSTALPVRLAH